MQSCGYLFSIGKRDITSVFLLCDSLERNGRHFSSIATRSNHPHQGGRSLKKLGAILQGVPGLFAQHVYNLSTQPMIARKASQFTPDESDCSYRLLTDLTLHTYVAVFVHARIVQPSGWAALIRLLQSCQFPRSRRSHQP